MMELTRQNWQIYLRNLRSTDEAAYRDIMDYLRDRKINANEKAFKEFTDYFNATVTKYAEAASEIAAQAYELQALTQGVYIATAIPAEPPSYGDCMKAINGTLLESNQPKSLAQAAGRLVRRTGADTTITNALRDGAEWAWVPNGDTCAFCMMLASNGWQKASKKALKDGHAMHIHANCDCTYAVRFDGESTVEGYDPDGYYDTFMESDGHKWPDMINSVRREQYAQNKDKINEQKRIAYRARKSGENVETSMKSGD